MTETTKEDRIEAVRIAEQMGLEIVLALCCDVDTLEEERLDANDRIDRWDQGWLNLRMLVESRSISMEEIVPFIDFQLAEVDCEHQWGPLPDWDNEEEPWEQCTGCKVNRPSRAKKETEG